MAAVDILSGEKIELWLHGKKSHKCPFACDSRELFVSFTESLKRQPFWRLSGRAHCACSIFTPSFATCGMA